MNIVKEHINFKRGLEPKRAMRTGKYAPNPENPNDQVFLIVNYNFPGEVRTIKKLLKSYYEDVYTEPAHPTDVWRIIIVNDLTATIEDISDLLYKYIQNKTIKTIDYVS